MGDIAVTASIFYTVYDPNLEKLKLSQINSQILVLTNFENRWYLTMSLADIFLLCHMTSALAKC